MTTNGYLDCHKRKGQPRISVSVCLFHKCENLDEKDGGFKCKLIEDEEKQLKRKEKKHGYINR